MPAVRQNSEKWARNSGNSSRDFAQGVGSPRRPWDQATQAAEAAFEAGISDAISRKAFSKGVQRTGSAGWSARVLEVGERRFREGVTAPSAVNRYTQRFAPFAAAIGSVQLPPKGPKGSNYGRVQSIGDALIAAKRGI